MNRKMKSCIKGLLMGCCGKPLPLSTAKKEPIAYSYNGVVMPAYPALDISRFPYNHMVEYPSGTRRVFATDRPGTFELYEEADGTSSYYVVFLYLAGDLIQYQYADYKENAWSQVELVDMSPLPNNSSMKTRYVFWSNHDIIDEKGNNIAIPASEPIPVYE